MAATGYSPIQLYYSTTASAAPTAGNLASGELAINITDGKLYYKDNAGAVQLLSTSTTATGTANGVLYLNASKVATAGSALVFDGSNLGVGGTATALSTYRGAEFAGTTTTTGGFLRMRTSDSSVNSLDFTDVNGRAIFTTTNHPMRFGVNDTEGMRLTTTGLGIGTSSPAVKFDVGVQGVVGSFGTTANDSGVGVRLLGASTQKTWLLSSNFFNGGAFQITRSTAAGGTTYSTPDFTLDSSGNLGIGTSSPSYKLDVQSAAATYAGSFKNSYGGDAGYGLYVETRYNTSGNYLARFTSNSGSVDVFTLKGDGTAYMQGNLGLGATPSAWGGSYKAFQISSTSRSLAATGAGAGDLTLAFNAVYDSTDSRWEYASTGDAAVRYSQTGAGIHAWYNAATGTAGNAITFTQAMTLDSSGNLLVGTTNNYSVGATNYVFAQSGFVWANNNTGNANNRNWNAGVNGYANGAWQLVVSSANNTWPNAAYAFAVTSAGSCYNITGTYGTMSDARFKENVQTARSYLTDLLKLRVVKYSLKSEQSLVATKLGLIAQEVEDVFPNMVDVGNTANGEEFKSVKMSVLVPMLLSAIQEQQVLIQQLTARVAQLESN